MSGSTQSIGPEVIHVAVGVVRNRHGDILITRRFDHVHQGGLWEFPGGKCEDGEPPQAALRRELWEELGIQVESATPLTRISHRYPDRKVLLDVWEVEQFSGEPYGRERQPLAWVKPERLHHFPFPKADLPILNLLTLPYWYAVMEGQGSIEGYRKRFQSLVDQGLTLVYLRARDLGVRAYQSLLEECLSLARFSGVCLMIRSDPKDTPVDGEGLHLASRQLRVLSGRPEGWQRVAAACHNLEDLMRAEALNLDFAILSPIQPTPTHPDAAPLGWHQARRWLEQVSIPVYLMGGLERHDLDLTRRSGAHGIAGIRLFAR